MKRVIKISIIALLHFIATVWSAMTTFHLSGFFFGVYPRANEGAYYTFMTNLSKVLLFPLGHLAMKLPSGGIIGWIVLSANSILWGAAIHLIIYYIFRPLKADK